MSTIAGLVLGVAVIAYGAVALYWAHLTRRHTRAAGAWYRARVAAGQRKSGDPGPINNWPDVAATERALLRLHPIQRTVTAVVLIAAAAAVLLAFV